MFIFELVLILFCFHPKTKVSFCLTAYFILNRVDRSYILSVTKLVENINKWRRRRQPPPRTKSTSPKRPEMRGHLQTNLLQVREERPVRPR